jgi:sugar phosphate isomerase/epimerase
MKLSCLPVSLYADLSAGRLAVPDWFRRAAALGLDGADISVIHLEHRTPADLDQLRQHAGEAGVEIAMLATYSDFTHPDASERTRQVDDGRMWIDVAARLGVGALRVTAGQAHPRVGDEEGMAWVTEGLTKCAQDAKAAGVRLLFENHVRGAPWALNDFTQSASRFLDIVRRTRDTGVEILFDTANNLVLHESPVDVLDAVLDRIGAVHLSDIARTGAFEPTIIGTGVAPIPELLRRIVSSGFDGWISIEEGSRTGPEAFEPAVAFADRAWVDAGGTSRDRAARPCRLDEGHRGP